MAEDGVDATSRLYTWKGKGESAPCHLGEIVTTERSPVTGNVMSIFKKLRRRPPDW